MIPARQLRAMVLALALAFARVRRAAGPIEEAP